MSSEAEIPKCNALYGKREYWEDRFAKEESYEWLVSYDHVKTNLDPYLEDLRQNGGNVLVVGCGNSSFSYDLHNDGIKNISSIDYSSNVINKMQSKYPELVWECMDMTNLSYPENTFDLVIDKAAMDALVTNEGDPWSPNEETKQITSKMMQSVARVLKPHGYFIQISFQQAHFRKKYLSIESMSAPTVSEINFGMGYFCFVQQKLDL